MREAIPSDLLLRLMQATPEQFAEVRRVLGMGPMTGEHDAISESPNHAGEDVARAAFRLVAQLDSDEIVKPPTVLTVFRLYCIEERSADEIAAKCGCSKGTVINRLRIIRDKTGREPSQLRQFATQFERIEKDASDARAEYIHRKALVDDLGDEQED